MVKTLPANIKKSFLTSKRTKLSGAVTAAELALKQFLKINYALQKMGSGSSVFSVMMPLFWI